MCQFTTDWRKKRWERLVAFVLENSFKFYLLIVCRCKLTFAVFDEFKVSVKFKMIISNKMN